MKKNQLVAFTAAGLLLASFGGVKALADDGQMVGDSKQTDTEVSIIDEDTEDPTDPSIPTDRIQLVHVPSNFQFETALKNGHYTIEGTVSDDKADNNIRVFNNRVNRPWTVKANIQEIKRVGDGYTIATPTLTIDETALKTGADSIVHSYTPETDEFKTNGIHEKLVKDITIEFDDPAFKLEQGNTLKGIVNYTLYAVPQEAAAADLAPN